MSWGKFKEQKGFIAWDGSAGNLKAGKIPQWERCGLDCIQCREERSTE